MTSKNAKVDLWYLLQRRKVSIQRWCEEHNVKNLVEFKSKVSDLESKDFIVPNEMVAAASSYFDKFFPAPVVVEKEENLTETVSEITDETTELVPRKTKKAKEKF